MVNFTSSLSTSNEGFVVFVSEKHEYSNNKNVLSKNISEKINSFISTLRKRKNNDNISSFDISNHQKCFLVKIENKKKSNHFQEKGADFFVYLKKSTINNSLKFIVNCSV